MQFEVRKLIPFFVFIPVLAGCFGGPPLVDRIPPATPGYLMLRGKVSLPQGRHKATNCGPETLCAALNYIGIPVSIEDVEHEIYNPAIQGAVAPQIVDYARRRGAKARFSEGGGLWKLRNHIEADSPIMIEVTRGGLYHYYLVVGMSPEVDKVAVCAYYGETQHLLSFDRLIELWRPTRFRSITFSVPAAEELCQDGWDFLRVGKLEPAEELFQKALKLQADYGPALHGLGLIRVRQDRLADALDLLERAAATIKGDPEFLNNLAHTLLALGKDPARAEKMAEEGVAVALQQLRDFEEELKLAPPGTKERVQADIENLRFSLFYYLGTWGQALETTGRTARSVEERERSLHFASAEDPNGLAKRHLETGLALRKLGETSRAAEHFRKGGAVARDEELKRKLDEEARR